MADEGNGGGRKTGGDAAGGEGDAARGKEDGLLKGLVDLATDWKVVVAVIAAATSVFFSFEERDSKRLEVNQDAIGYVREAATLDRFWVDPANTINEIQASYPQHAFCATLGVFLAETTRAEIAETAGTGWDRQITAVSLRSSREALYEETARVAAELSYPLCLLEETARATAAKSVPLAEGVDPSLVTPPDERPGCRPEDAAVPNGCAAIRAATSPYWRQLAANECLMELDAYGENRCLAEVALRRHVNIEAQQRAQPNVMAMPAEPERPVAMAARDAGDEDLAALLSAADPEAGALVFRRCAACHRLEEGENTVGPHLWGIVGREIASVAGYGYSDALSARHGVWDAEALDGYLADPNGWAPGTTMAYAGLRDAKGRADVIAFLNAADGSPAPLVADRAPAAGGGASGAEAPDAPVVVPRPVPPASAGAGTGGAPETVTETETETPTAPGPEPEAPAGPGGACAGGSPLIFSHVARAEDVDWADSVLEDLRGIGWDITRPEAQPAARTSGDVRYYWPDQDRCAAALAHDVARLIGAEPGRSLKTISLAGTYKNLPRGRMELWLPPL